MIKWSIVDVIEFKVQIVTKKENIHKVQRCNKDTKIISKLKFSYLTFERRKGKDKNKTYGERN